MVNVCLHKLGLSLPNEIRKDFSFRFQKLQSRAALFLIKIFLKRVRALGNLKKLPLGKSRKASKKIISVSFKDRAGFFKNYRSTGCGCGVNGSLALG